jgi:hypothetical protein
MTFDLRQAARAHRDEALRVVVKAMRSEDEEVRVMASRIMRKFGNMIEASQMSPHGAVKFPDGD